MPPWKYLFSFRKRCCFLTHIHLQIAVDEVFHQNLHDVQRIHTGHVVQSHRKTKHVGVHSEEVILFYCLSNQLPPQHVVLSYFFVSLKEYGAVGEQAIRITFVGGDFEAEHSHFLVLLHVNSVEVIIAQQRKGPSVELIGVFLGDFEAQLVVEEVLFEGVDVGQVNLALDVGTNQETVNDVFKRALLAELSIVLDSKSLLSESSFVEGLVFVVVLVEVLDLVLQKLLRG